MYLVNFVCTFFFYFVSAGMGKCSALSYTLLFDWIRILRWLRIEFCRVYCPEDL